MDRNKKQIALCNQEVKQSTLALIQSLGDPSSEIMGIRKMSSHLINNGLISFKNLLGDSTTQISVIKKQQGGDMTAATLVFSILNDLNEYFNVKNKMTEHQLRSLSIDIIEELWSCRIEEIIAFCHQFKKGMYIKVYERLDASIFWEAWAMYEKEKEKFLYNNHLDLKQSVYRSDREIPEANINGVIGSISSIKEVCENLKKIEKKDNGSK